MLTISLSLFNMLVFTKIILFCFWFCLSIYTYKYMLPENSLIKLHINRLSFIELFTLVGIAMLLYICLLENLESLFNYIDINHNAIQSNFIGENNNTVATDATNSTSEATPNNNSGSQSNSNNNQSSNSAISSNKNNDNNSTVNTNSSVYAKDITDKLGNSACFAITTAISGGFKLAQKAPSLASKSAIMASSLFIGATGIVAKDAAAAASINRHSNSQKLVSWYVPNNENNSSILDSLFNLTGNSAIDLLNLIQVFQKIQLLLIPLIGYNLVLYFISEEKMESILLKILPIKIVNIYMKSFRVFKLQGIFILLCLIVLLYISNYLAYLYLDFYLTNVDKLIEIYLKDFNK